MVQYTKVLALSSRELDQRRKPDGPIQIIPDGNSRLREELRDPYDKAGKKVFEFLNYVNKAFFHILSGKNLEHRSAVFFKELRQSFLVLKLAILQGSVWGDGIDIKLDINEDLFHTGENIEEKEHLLEEIKAIAALNRTMATDHGQALNKIVTLRFGTSEDPLENSPVLRTGSDGSHRFSDMFVSSQPFVSVVSETAFGALDHVQINTLLQQTEAATIDLEARGFTQQEAIDIIEGISPDELEAAPVHLTLACEELNPAVVEAVRKAVRDKAIHVIQNGEEIPEDAKLVLELQELDLSSIGAYQGVILGGQKNKPYAVIPPCNPKEARFYLGGTANELGGELKTVIHHLTHASHLEGADRDHVDTFDSRFSEVLERCVNILQILYQNLLQTGFDFILKTEHIQPEKIPEFFIFENKVSLPAISSYVAHIVFTGQVANLEESEIFAMVEYVLCTYLIDQIFDAQILTSIDRDNIKKYLVSDEPLREGIFGYESIKRVKKLLDKVKSQTNADSKKLGLIFKTRIDRLIELMAVERQHKYTTLEDYTERNSASFGAGLVILRLEASIGNEDVFFDESERANLMNLIDKIARLINDIQTYNCEPDKSNAVTVLIDNGYEVNEAIAAINAKISSLKEELTNKISKYDQTKKLTKALKGFIYFGININEYAAGAEEAFGSLEKLRKSVNQYDEERYI